MEEPVLHKKKKLSAHWLIKAAFYFLIIEIVVLLLAYDEGLLCLSLPAVLFSLGIALLEEKKKGEHKNLPAWILISFAFLTLLPLLLLLLLLPYFRG